MDLRGWGVRVVGLGVAVAVLAGCSGDAEPVVTPSPSPTETETVVESPTPTPSPSPTALTEEEILAALPEEARTGDFIGAVYFSQFFIELYPQMFAGKQDAGLFTALSDSSCSFCLGAIESALVTADANAYSVGSEFTWSPALEARGGLRDDGYWYLSQRFDVTATTTYSADGAIVSEDEAGSGTVGVMLERTEDRWQVHGVEFHYDDAH